MIFSNEFSSLSIETFGGYVIAYLTACVIFLIIFKSVFLIAYSINKKNG